MNGCHFWCHGFVDHPMLLKTGLSGEQRTHHFDLDMASVAIRRIVINLNLVGL